jgi:TonB family protein
MEFVEVQIVPLQALGVPEPIAPRPEPRRREEPKVVPLEAAPEESASAPAAPSREQRSEPADDENETAGPSAEAPAQRQGSPQGSPLATSPFGTAVAGFDNPDFVYGYYVEQMLAMIGSNWTRPAVEEDTEMTIHFRIHSNGELSELEIVTPSGHSSFDLAGLRAVRLASPLPPLPRSFPHDSLGVNLIIR